jgi:hypothetical protein
VSLGGAGEFAILARSAITTRSDAGSTTITGDIGVSPSNAENGLIDFAQTNADASNAFATAAQVDGKVYAADYAPPTPALLAAAVSDMMAAYDDAAGRPFTTGEFMGIPIISGHTFTAGVYRWGTSLSFNTDIWINGSASDTIIFQVAGDLSVGDGATVNLIADGTDGGEPKASKIVWQVGGYIAVGANAKLEGTLMVLFYLRFYFKHLNVRAIVSEQR